MLTAWNGDLEIAAAVLTAGFIDYPVPQSETPADIARQISDGYISPDASWMALHEGSAVGGIFGATRADKRARIHSMAVAPAHRRRGAGRQLLAAFLRGMDAAGIGAVHLEVIETNGAARALYESAGFARVRALRCLRSSRHEGGPTAVVPAELAGPPASYAAREAPLHRDFIALAAMPNVKFHRLPSGAWSAHRGTVLLAAEGWSDREELNALLSAISPGAALKMIDVPEDDRLGEALAGLGWSSYTQQLEMVRRP
jgi:ribosomal protein S18 acetylase RimI-like enzyme